MKRRIAFLAVTSIAAFLCEVGSVHALYKSINKGTWPESWPKELEPLRTKLPEEMKELPGLALLRDAGLARDALARLEPQLAARLAGEEDA